ncbi:hypothetical protein [Tenacibaculum sp. A30]|uniref:hypothetical protein n=1 Tax=Tenacibaculum sp. A30 TaxID=3442644 RepID=UPI003EBD43BA
MEKRLNLEELKEKRLELGLSDYLTGGTSCTAKEVDDLGRPLGSCLPCENYCHDA